MTADTIWTDQAPPAPPVPPAPPAEWLPLVPDGPPPKRVSRTAPAVLVSLLVLAGFAVGLILFVGSSASAAGGCGGG